MACKAARLASTFAAVLPVRCGAACALCLMRVRQAPRLHPLQRLQLHGLALHEKQHACRQRRL